MDWYGMLKYAKEGIIVTSNSIWKWFYKCVYVTNVNVLPFRTDEMFSTCCSGGLMFGKWPKTNLMKIYQNV